MTRFSLSGAPFFLEPRRQSPLRGSYLRSASNPVLNNMVPVSWAFALLALLAAATSFATRNFAAGSIDWQPSLAASQPWRWWTAAFVHYSPLHLWANLAGTVLVGALGVAGRVPTAFAVAWLFAWPLTQLGLLIDPRLLHYGGLSGVLHAGVALIAVFTMAQSNRMQRTLGVLIFFGLLIKVLTEKPWAGPLQFRPGWDFPIAPLAHATGLLSGVALGLLCLGIERHRRGRRATSF